MKIKISKGKGSVVFFNYKKGTTLILGDSYYRKEGPILLDVSITNRCNRGCHFCYRHAKPFGEDISIDDYKRILDQAKQCGVNQIAIGGGEPTLHPFFIDILKTTKEADIVPNYSTNADYLTNDIIKATRDYCGSMAISVYGDINKYEETVLKLRKYGVMVNLHFILNKHSLEICCKMLQQPPEWFSKVNAIIFLNYKPINSFDDCLSKSNSFRLQEFFSTVQNFKVCSIGFDSCMVSFIAKYMDVPDKLLTFCESARYSAYVNEKMEVLPCSFYNAKGADLRKHSLKEIWQKDQLFNGHRSFSRQKCSMCPVSNQCRFGCPIYNISICD